MTTKEGNSNGKKDNILLISVCSKSSKADKCVAMTGVQVPP